GGDGNDALTCDGSETDQADDYADGGAGDDIILALGGNDVVVGGTGSDALYGGAGSNTFVQEAGGAATPKGDVIWLEAGSTNVLQLGAGLDRTLVQLLRTGDDIQLRFQGLTDLITLKAAMAVDTAGAPVTGLEVAFADGSSWQLEQITAELLDP